MSAPDLPRHQVRAARVAITAVFALNGALFANLFTRLPAIRADLDLSPGDIGLGLFCAMIGLIAAQPVAGALTVRYGSRPLVLFGAVLYSVGLLPVAAAPSLALLCLAFAVVGFGSGTLDVSMNVQGITVERALRRPILGGLHAAFSFGALGGSLIGAGLAAAGVDHVVHLGVWGAVSALAAVALDRRLLPAAADAAPEGPRFARPTRELASLGALGFCVLLAEGSVGDWAAVLLDGELGTGQGTAALGLAAFSLAMGIGRLVSDRLVEAAGPARVVRGGGLLAAAGLGAGLAAGEPALAIAGFGVMGIGLAALFPITVRAAGAGPQETGAAVAAVSGAGYVGFVTGPPTIGFIAEATSLRAALGLVALVCLLAALLSRAVRTPQPDAPSKAGVPR